MLPRFDDNFGSEFEVRRRKTSWGNGRLRDHGVTLVVFPAIRETDLIIEIVWRINRGKGSASM
jgi:hypothetical protein